MNTLKDTLCYKLLMIFSQIKEVSKNDFQKLGITRENYVMLRCVCENPGLTQAELADMVRKDRNVISKSIDKLEEKQYIERVRGKSDRRSFSLYLTKSGGEVAQEYWASLLAGEEERLQRLTGDEQKAFFEMLNKLMD